MKTLKEYVIRDMMTGLFLRGKSSSYSKNPQDPIWSKTPRRFKRLSDLSTHLNHGYRIIQPTWEVIEYEMVETGRFSAATLTKVKKR